MALWNPNESLTRIWGAKARAVMGLEIIGGHLDTLCRAAALLEEEQTRGIVPSDRSQARMLEQGALAAAATLERVWIALSGEDDRKIHAALVRALKDGLDAATDPDLERKHGVDGRRLSRPLRQPRLVTPGERQQRLFSVLSARGFQGIAGGLPATQFVDGKWKHTALLELFDVWRSTTTQRRRADGSRATSKYKLIAAMLNDAGVEITAASVTQYCSLS